MEEMKKAEIYNRLQKIQQLCMKALDIHKGNSLIIEISNQILYLSEDLNDNLLLPKTKARNIQ